jgi:ferric-dicitrate binding protein FerR (iron transport regulator)
MPSKKQRRRREKDRRHEYEYVYVDEEGHELDPSEVDEGEEEQPAKPARASATATKTKPKAAAAKKGPAAKGKASANIRPVPPPSWRRVAKRGLIFAPFMLLAIALLGRGLTWPARILETVWLLVLFVPFSYMIDRMMYRRYLRQIGEEPPARQRRA